MVSDYFPKPLQGSLFQVHQTLIMGLMEADKADSFNESQKYLK